MGKHGATKRLKEKIHQLETRQAEEAKILKKQFDVTVESLKPSNLIKSTLKEMSGPAELKNSLLETVVSVLTGYLTQKVIVGRRKGIMKKLFGLLVQHGVTNLIANNAETLRGLFGSLFGKILKARPKSASSKT
jgi:hypothetical protein